MNTPFLARVYAIIPYQLIIASQHGRSGVIRDLLLAGSGIESADKGGHTAFAHACINHEFGAAQALIKARALVDSRGGVVGMTALLRAVRFGEEEVARYLLDEAKANVLLPDLNGTSPMAAAAYLGKEKLIELLRIHKANVDQQDKDGRTPFMRATEQGHVSALRTLLSLKASPLLCTNSGRSSLMEASRVRGRTVNYL
eukprot:jgi/Bigna1/40736/e_gw1.45.47.1